MSSTSNPRQPPARSGVESRSGPPPSSPVNLAGGEDHSPATAPDEPDPNLLPLEEYP